MDTTLPPPPSPSPERAWDHRGILLWGHPMMGAPIKRERPDQWGPLDAHGVWLRGGGRVVRSCGGRHDTRQPTSEPGSGGPHLAPICSRGRPSGATVSCCRGRKWWGCAAGGPQTVGSVPPPSVPYLFSMALHCRACVARRPLQPQRTMVPRPGPGREGEDCIHSKVGRSVNLVGTRNR